MKIFGFKIGKDLADYGDSPLKIMGRIKLMADLSPQDPQLAKRKEHLDKIYGISPEIEYDKAIEAYFGKTRQETVNEIRTNLQPLINNYAQKVAEGTMTATQAQKELEEKVSDLMQQHIENFKKISKELKAFDIAYLEYKFIAAKMNGGKGDRSQLLRIFKEKLKQYKKEDPEEFNITFEGRKRLIQYEFSTKLNKAIIEAKNKPPTQPVAVSSPNAAATSPSVYASPLTYAKGLHKNEAASSTPNKNTWKPALPTELEHKRSLSQKETPTPTTSEWKSALPAELARKRGVNQDDLEKEKPPQKNKPGG